MSHYTLFINDILNKNFLFQEEVKEKVKEKVKEESLFSSSYVNVNDIKPTLLSNSYTFIYHRLTTYSYAKYKEKYDYLRKKTRSFYAK